MSARRWPVSFFCLAVAFLSGAARAQVPSAAGTLAAKPDLHGTLTENAGIRLLTLSGDAEQAGYAQGYLLAREIVDVLDEFMFDEKILPNVQIYETILVPTMRRQFVWSEDARRELTAMCRGIHDRLGEQDQLKRLERPIEVDDLMAGNALADWYEMFCSTFSAWGDLTFDGRTLTGRNLDFPSTTKMQASQLVVQRRRPGGPSWIGVSWPGMIGAYTAMNSLGVTITMHDADGLAPSESIGFTPRSVILRAALEAARPVSFVDDVRTVLEQHKVLVGNNFHVSTPFHADRTVAAVFEYDGNTTSKGVSVRVAPAAPAAQQAALVSANVAEAPREAADYLCCTNHMRTRQTPVHCDRYERLTQSLDDLRKSGGKLTSDSALELIRSVRQRITLHTVVFDPASLSMRVLIPPISDQPVEFKLETDSPKATH